MPGVKGYRIGQVLKAVAVSTCLALPCCALAQTSPATLPDVKLSTAGYLVDLAVQDDGKVIVCGSFDAINSIPRTNLARLNPNGSLDLTWNPPIEGDVSCILSSGNHVYLGGRFFLPGGSSFYSLMRVSAVDGSLDPVWRPPDFGFSFPWIAAMALVGNELYIAGSFSSINGTPRRNLAKLLVIGAGGVESDWNPNADGAVQKLVVQGSDVFVAGSFNSIGGQSRVELAKISALGNGEIDPDWKPVVVLQHPGQTWSLGVAGTNLFVAGSFRSIGGVQRAGFAKLSTLGAGLVDTNWNPTVPILGFSAFAFTNDYLFAGASLGGQIAPGQPRDRILKLRVGSGASDTNWTATFDSAPSAIQITPFGIFAVGGFKFCNGALSLAIAKVDLLTGARDPFFAAQVQSPGNAYHIVRQPDGKIIFGGDFLFAGGLPRRHLARLNEDGTLDNSWVPDLNGGVNALALSGTNVFVAGLFTRVGGLNRTNLVKLALYGSDAPDPLWDARLGFVGIYSLLASGTNLFVGGSFDRIGGQSRISLAKLQTTGAGDADPFWQADVWRPPSVGHVGALALSTNGNDLFVGGWFESVAGINRRHLAKVSALGFGAVDTTWNANITGVGHVDVDFLAVGGADVFIGGEFGNIGGRPRSALAKASVTSPVIVDPSWNPMGSGSSAYVQCMAVGDSGTTLYIAGAPAFNLPLSLLRISTVSGAIEGSRQLDFNSNLSALLPVGNDLYVAGRFSRIFGATRYGLAFLPVIDAPELSHQDLAVFVRRNAVDGPEVTHFQILDVSGGELSLSDGNSLINPGDFITVAQGEAGLKFVPAETNTSITALSSVNATLTGVGVPTTTLNFSAIIPPIFRFGAAAYSVSEDIQGAILSIPIRKFTPGTGTVSFAAQSESADLYDVESGEGDYLVLNPGPLSFAMSDSVKTIRILINDDELEESDETFTIRLTGVAGNGAIGYPAIARVTIVDDECEGPHGSLMDFVLPEAPPASTGSLQVSIPPPPTDGQWRLSGDPFWRDAGSVATGLASGFYQVEFKPTVGYRTTDRVTVGITAGMTSQVSGLYISQPTEGYGDLKIVISPQSVATNLDDALRGRWRVAGDSWRESGEAINLFAGAYEVEFSEVMGWLAPRNLLVTVVPDGECSTPGVYQPTNPAQTVPEPLSLAEATTVAPYLYNGMIETEFGFGSGVVVKERVVLTAAHVLFDDYTLSYAKRAKWFFQKHRGEHEAIGQTPRGWYVRQGYAAHRANSPPGISTRDSQQEDVAAMYFVPGDNLAGRGGYGGFLASDSGEWLLNNRLKILVGYPVSGISALNKGKMHATTPANIFFGNLYGSVYATPDLKSYPGGSGGPLYVQADNGQFYPAGIYLGGAGQTLVRAIDEEVVCLVNLAELSSNGEGNFTGGGVALWSPGLTVDEFMPGLVGVTIGPSNAVRAGAAWRVRRAPNDFSAYFDNDDLVTPLVPGDFPVEFKSVPGFATPASIIIRATVNQTNRYSVSYPVFKLSAPVRWADGSFQFTLNAARGRAYTVEVSSDMLGWTNLATLTNTTGSNIFRQNSSHAPRNFYRVRER